MYPTYWKPFAPIQDKCKDIAPNSKHKYQMVLYELFPLV